MPRQGAGHAEETSAGRPCNCSSTMRLRTWACSERQAQLVPLRGSVLRGSTQAFLGLAHVPRTVGTSRCIGAVEPAAGGSVSRRHEQVPRSKGAVIPESDLAV